MGQVLHGSATTTEAIRRAIQHSQESMRSLARRHGINPKTVAKWKKRESTVDRRTGPVLEQIQGEFNGSATGSKKISVADLIVLAGGAAIEKAAKDAGINVTVPFTPGRTDASQEQTDVESFEPLEPKADGFRSYGYMYPEPAEVALLDKTQLLRLTAPELTVLIGALRVLNTNFGGTKFGVFTDRPKMLTNDFFVNLLDMKYGWKATDGTTTSLRVVSESPAKRSGRLRAPT